MIPKDSNKKANFEKNARDLRNCDLADAFDDLPANTFTYLTGWSSAPSSNLAFLRHLSCTLSLAHHRERVPRVRFLCGKVTQVDCNLLWQLHTQRATKKRSREELVNKNKFEWYLGDWTDMMWLQNDLRSVNAVEISKNHSTYNLMIFDVFPLQFRRLLKVKKNQKTKFRHNKQKRKGIKTKIFTFQRIRRRIVCKANQWICENVKL
jgi:hypothetical protein